MKKLLIYFTILFGYNLYCNGQSRDTTMCVKRDTLRSSMEFCYNGKQPKHLITNTDGHKNVITFFSNGRIKTIGTIINSYPAGYNLVFYENGKILSEGYYRIYKEGSNLTLKSTSNNVDDRGFMDSGDTSIMVVENNEYYIPKEGVWKYYYPSGILKQVTSYKIYAEFNSESQQVKDGVWEFYNEKGILIRKTEYKDDKIKRIQIF